MTHMKSDKNSTSFCNLPKNLPQVWFNNFQKLKMLLFETIAQMQYWKRDHQVPWFVGYIITKHNEYTINNLEAALEAEQFGQRPVLC